MNERTRRGFLRDAAAAGTVLAGSTLGIGAAADAVEAAVGGTDGDEPVVARVRDLRHGVVTLYVGDRELTRRDKALAARLARAAREH